MIREAAKPYRIVNFEEFLGLEEQSDVRHELVGGIMHAQAGSNRRHNVISHNLHVALDVAVRGTSFRVYGSDMLLRIRDDVAYYPDFTITCSASDDHEQFNRDPTVIIEILSHSTASKDRREKWSHYQSLPSLLAYLMIEPSRHSVVRHWREAPTEGWETSLHTTGSVPLPGLDRPLEFEDIYRNLTPLRSPSRNRY